jgi:uncharacterized membrane protein YqjE
MTDTDRSGVTGPAERLLRLGERLLSLLVEAGRTRAELVAVEFAVEKTRLLQFLAMGLVFCISVLLGLAFASMLVIVYFWDTHRLAAIAVVTIVYAVIAVVMAVMMRRQWTEGAPPFAHTLDTLHRDFTAVQERARRAKSAGADPDVFSPDGFVDTPQPPLPRDPS